MTDHKKCWVYIVASRTGTLYIGMTNNLYVRVMQHKSGEIEGFSSEYKCKRPVIGKASMMCAKQSTGKSSSRVGGGRRRLF